MSVSASTPLRAVIAGGGFAAMEAALALQEIAGDAVSTTVVTPATELVYRPMTVLEPFAHPTAVHYPLPKTVADAGAELVPDTFAWVNAEAKTAYLTSGNALQYDALLLALGARRYERFPHATTIDDTRLDDIFHGIVQDVEGGYLRSLAFVIPAEGCWPLPLYELAMLTAQRARDMGEEVSITVVTPERAPLAAFGTGASGAVSELLTEMGVGVEAHATCQVPDGRHVVIRPGDRTLEADRIIALPELHGPSVRGLPGGAHGFIPVDQLQRVKGQSTIFAAGDATDFPIKHGGLAAQQADVAAVGIAALAGVPVEVKPLQPVIEGLLLTGKDPLYLKATLVGGAGFRSETSNEPLWSPPMKVAARYLAPYLDRLERPGA